MLAGMSFNLRLRVPVACGLAHSDHLVHGDGLNEPAQVTVALAMFEGTLLFFPPSIATT